MRHIHLQPAGGIAGDMFVAAMLHTFPAIREGVLKDIAAVLPESVGEVRLTQVLKNGIAALHFSLDEHSSGKPDPDLHVDLDSTRVYRKVNASLNAAAARGHHHVHSSLPVSNYTDIRKLIDGATLSGTTALHALAILEILGRAESHIHNVSIESVHFHELAAWDSLIDVVAAGSVVSALGDATWTIADLPLGSGQVKTQHGLLPVPAPATMRILEGYPWRSDDIPGERVTPTGAAIVRYLVPPENLSLRPTGVLAAAGYGAGTRNFSAMPNVLRVLAFEGSQVAATDDDTVISIHFDVDDMTGEEIGVAADILRREQPVRDLVLIAAQGKKGRPVTMFQLLIDPQHLDDCAKVIFRETSTIGLRWSVMRRKVLLRNERYAENGLRVKDVVQPNGSVTTKVESDELESFEGLTFRRRTKSRAEEKS